MSSEVRVASRLTLVEVKGFSFKKVVTQDFLYLTCMANAYHWITPVHNPKSTTHRKRHLYNPIVIIIDVTLRYTEGNI